MAGDGIRGLAQARMTLHADDRPGLRHQIYSCKQCASCREWHWNDPRLPGFEPGVTKEGFVICPVFRHTAGAESDYARGKVKLQLTRARQRHPTMITEDASELPAPDGRPRHVGTDFVLA